MNRSLVLSIADSSRVGEARREAVLLAQQVGFGETAVGKLSIVVTEMAGNMVKHARGGQLLLRQLQEGDHHGLEVLAVDKGPGMADVAKCLVDGYSTAGSPGTGLGAIARLASYFEIYSEPAKGTVVLAELWAKPVGRSNSPLGLGAVCAPIKEREANGDAWGVRHEGQRSLVLVVDGLGHGPLAARAADTALEVFHMPGARSGVELIRDLHGALRPTRGASLAVAEIDYEANVVRYTGVGNISGLVGMDGASRNMISYNGTVGHELHQVRELAYPWSANALLILHSDGLMTRWDLKNYPGLVTRHPSIIAAVLYRDFARGRDDVTVLIGRDRRAGGSPR